MGDLLLAVSDLDTLYRAWRDVRANVAQTAWPHITGEMQAMDAAPLRVLLELQTALREQNYQFAKKHGYTKRKSGGSRRGIAIHSVRDRIVQRAMLDVFYTADSALQRQLGQLPAVLNHPRSFAGTPGRGLPQAIACIVELIKTGAGAYVYSDMKDFFPCVPRAEVAGFVRANVDDAEFADLFARALTTELDNADALDGLLDLFPGPSVGVAQGSLLSVLAGNITMRRFDELLNADGLAMVRYLDDFVILASDVNAVQRGFDTARAELARLGMACYLPGDGSQKAFLGRVADGFDFLGCRIHPSGVSPSSKNRRKFLRALQSIVAAAKQEIRAFKTGAKRHRRAEQTYLQTLALLDRKIRGWGDAYQFVTNRVTFAQMDAAIDEMLTDFRCWFARQLGETEPRVQRRMLGVALLADTPPQKLK
mgnify:CR=1 FL=1